MNNPKPTTPGEQKKVPERPWNLAKFPNDGRTPLRVGDVLQVTAINPDVTDMHFGRCVSYELVRAVPADERVAELSAAVRLLMEGWEVSKASLYDEEGVEGWRWTKDDREYCEIGSWDELPTVPDELLEPKQ